MRSYTLGIQHLAQPKNEKKFTQDAPIITCWRLIKEENHWKALIIYNDYKYVCMHELSMGRQPHPLPEIYKITLEKLAHVWIYLSRYFKI